MRHFLLRPIDSSSIALSLDHKGAPLFFQHRGGLETKLVYLGLLAAGAHVFICLGLEAGIAHVLKAVTKVTAHCTHVLSSHNH